MRTLPISQIKDHLSEVLDSAHLTGDQVTVTKNGVPAAVIVGIDDWEELQERLFWLSEPGLRDYYLKQDAKSQEIRAKYGRHQ